MTNESDRGIRLLIFRRWRGTQEVDPRVDEHDLPGGLGGQVGTQENGCISHVLGGDVLTQGGHLSKVLVHSLESPNTHCCQGADGASGNSVYTDTLRAKVVGQVHHRGIQGGFSDAHDIVTRK